jgi:L-serine dehydratase
MIPNRIRITGLTDAIHKMKEYGIHDLATFFLVYESKNQVLSEDKVVGQMEKALSAMEESIQKGKMKANITPSGLIQGGALKVKNFLAEGKSILSPVFTDVIYNTLAVAELNACMGRIVAAPTAGASGVLPGAFLTIAKNHQVSREKMIQCLFIAGGIGEVIALRASLAGASHGCQAENGSASAMTAAALCYLSVADPVIIESAACFALKNLLGLVCDPIAGLVEIPCVKRNVVASVNAIACAEMALAGIQTVIPFDEVVSAMEQIGNTMPSSLKETSQGGLAVCNSCKRYIL